MPLVEVRHSIPAGDPGRVDLVVQQLTQRSRADVRGLFAHGCVTVNGAACSEPGTRANPGEEIVVRHDPQRRYHAPPPERTNPAFRLVFEDQHLLVVDKAAHILTVATDRYERNTLVEAVTRHLRRKHPKARPGVVHRLDRGTSGLLVFGVNERVAEALREQFRVRKAEREYVAIVAGVVPTDSGTIRSKLATTKTLHRHSVSEDEQGEPAVTHYEVAERLWRATVVRVRLETGRRNQIRVQFAEHGFPVLGDDKYRPDEARHPNWKARRLALHACRLGFDHPVTGEVMNFESPWPDEFQRFIERSRPRI
jgi:23S rRNA pseudouridine1911/1915/1917 synthase